MSANERIWMTPQAHARLRAELSALRSRCHTVGPDERAVYDDTLVANDAAREARIRQIEDLLTHAAAGAAPPDDGIAEPGMVLTIRYDDSGEIEKFLLGVRGAEAPGIEVYSLQSPLGRAITGARVGEHFTYSVPNGARLSVTLLAAVPYGIDAAESVHSRSTA